MTAFNALQLKSWFLNMRACKSWNEITLVEKYGECIASLKKIVDDPNIGNWTFCWKNPSCHRYAANVVKTFDMEKSPHAEKFPVSFLSRTDAPGSSWWCLIVIIALHLARLGHSAHRGKRIDGLTDIATIVYPKHSYACMASVGLNSTSQYDDKCWIWNPQ